MRGVILDRQASVEGLGSNEEGSAALGLSRQSTHLLRTMLGAAGGLGQRHEGTCANLPAFRAQQACDSHCSHELSCAHSWAIICPVPLGQ